MTRKKRDGGFILYYFLYSKSGKGFTLIELLVVIAIIGILSSVVLASLNTARVKGRIAQAQTSLKSFSTALAMCLNDSVAITPGAPAVPSGIACTIGTTNYSWPTLPTAGSWSYTTASSTLGTSFGFVATGDGKTIRCTENGCTTI